MYDINKGGEPASLTIYRQLPGAVYDGPNFTNVKDDIRNHLLLEQGHTCAYCMSRINFTNMKVEHWACQQRNSNLQLSYQNLLGCCNGNEGTSPNNQTCDTKKGNLDLSYSPADRQHSVSNIVRYSSDGGISSSDFAFNIELNSVLNLNYYRLRENRKSVLQAVQTQLNNKAGSRTKVEIRKLIQVYEQKNANNQFKPYYGAVISYLNSKL